MENKKSTLFIALFLAFMLVSGVLSRAKAVTVFEKQYEGAEKSAKEQFPNVESTGLSGTTAYQGAATRIFLYHLSMGKLATLAGSEDTIQNRLAQDTDGGLVGMMYTTMYSTYDYIPSQNIPGVYAQHFLPQEFQSTGGVYASDSCDSGGIISKAPACQSADVYWTQFNLDDLWMMSFSLAMIIVVGVLVAAGFMVMFRSKITNGQKTVSITIAVQNVIVSAALSLASFSFGAFFINLAKFLTLVVSDLFYQQLWPNISSNPLTDIVIKQFIGSTYISNPLSIFIKFVAVGLYGDLASFASAVSGGLFGGITIPGATLAGIIEKLFFFGGNNIPLMESPFYLISRLIAAGVLLWYSINIWLETVKIFLRMTLSTIIAPITFVIAAIPGQQKSISNWFKAMLKDALTLPLMFALVNIAAYIILYFAFHSESGVINPIDAISGGYYGNSGNADASSIVNGFAGIVLAGVGPAFIAMLLILSFVPKVPAFMQEIMPTSSNDTVTNAMSSFGTQATAAVSGGLGAFASTKGNIFKRTWAMAKNSFTNGPKS